MSFLSATDLTAAESIVHAQLAPTPQYAWPLLRERLGATVWVKHENHGPVGAFKVRGGLVYLHELRRREPRCTGVISATRGNHGQSIARAARAVGLTATIVVPRGNSVEKNAAMRALGAELIEHGEDFQQSRERAAQLAAERGLHFVPAFHPDLVRGVATYWLEFLRAVQPDVLYVPIGMGSGACAAIEARSHLGLRMPIVGVVSAHATAYLESFRAGQVIERPTHTVLADGMACRLPDEDALRALREGLEDVVAVSDEEVAEAMRVLFSDTHNVAEGAGAAALAAAMQQRARWQGRTLGVTLSGGNVDRELFARVLAGGSR